MLTDPLLFNPGERTLDPCPKRVAHPQALGKLDAIVISHCHLDHFDDESLHKLDRGVPMYMPRDEELAKRALALGFRDVCQLAPWDEVAIGGVKLFVTPSFRDDVEEMGMVFSDATGALWNQVDTVVTQATCSEVLRRVGELDACFCAYNPLLEHATMWNEEVEFPLSRYERLLEMALCSQARVLVPGSFGLCMTGAYAHFNKRCYPVSRERFVADIGRVAPEQAALILNPGQGITIAHGRAPTLIDTAYATLIEDDSVRVRFDPTEPVPDLVDYNPTRFAIRELERGLAHIITRVWPQHATELLAQHVPGPLLTLKSRRATIDFEVIFPEHRRRWRLSQWNPIVITEVEDAIADYTFTYVASQVYALALGRPYKNPEIAAKRRLSARPDGLTPIDPARLSGVDPYVTTDESFSWTPLTILEGMRL